MKYQSVLEPDDVRSTSMGASGPDIQLSPAAASLFPYSVECKALAEIAVYKFYEQAVAQEDGFEPLVVIKGNNKKPLAIVDLEHFMEIQYAAKRFESKHSHHEAESDLLEGRVGPAGSYRIMLSITEGSDTLRSIEFLPSSENDRDSR